jgi:DNA repair photolyase
MDLVNFPIISCSRRTDIPAFLMDWVIQQIKIGHVDVINPFNRKQISRVSLSSEFVKAWVWWSKNFENWIKVYNEYKNLFRMYKGHSFQFTINSPSELENNVKISLENRFKQLEWLINEFGLIAVNFRFDPIILYKKHDSKKIKSNLDKFEYILENIYSLGLKEMIFSFATIYNKVKIRMNARGYTPLEPSFEQKREILEKIIDICSNYNIKMKACCQPDLLKIEGIEQAHCIDAYKIEKIVGEPIPRIRDTGQRENCGCFKSKDIGGYSGIFRCKHNCAYCYASPAKR